jgi:arylsulfatase A-like enzyme
VVFTSDNGGERFSDVWPFTGSKGGVYEGSNRVPAIVRFPGVLPERKVSEQVAATFDWTATILAAAGVQANPAYPFDGVDLVPLLQRAGRGVPTQPRQLFWRIGGQRAVRDGNLKYVRLANASQVVTEGGLPAALLGTEFLFDVVDDPRERANLLAARPEEAARLSAAWEAWNATVLPEPATNAGG